MWFISFTYVTEHVRRDYPVKDVVGMDVGIRKTCFLSNGESHKIDNERILFLEGKKARLQRFLDRKDKKNKSKRYLKFARKIAMIDRLISNVRSNFNHHLSKHITDTFPIIGGEDLSIKHMMASASGTVESPGHNVKQKSGLNRAIARQGWGQLRSMVAYKQKRNGGVYTLINPAYTSLTCTSCGHVSKSNRNGECFKCENCGKEIDADYNASIEIRKRTIESLPKEVFDKFNIDKDVL
jgi:putative transposase